MKIKPKIPPKIKKMKIILAHRKRWFNPNPLANPEFTRCGNHPNILPLFERLERSLTSLLSSPRH
jgi:hypothetical protein